MAQFIFFKGEEVMQTFTFKAPHISFINSQILQLSNFHGLTKQQLKSESLCCENV